MASFHRKEGRKTGGQRVMDGVASFHRREGRRFTEGVARQCNAMV